MKALHRRLDALEQRAATRPGLVPPYITLSEEEAEDVTAALQARGITGFVKTYVGLSPDEWDDES